MDILDRSYDETYTSEQLKGALSELMAKLEAIELATARSSPAFRQTAEEEASTLQQFSTRRPRIIKHSAIQNKILHSTVIKQSASSSEESILTLHQNGLAVARDIETGLIHEAIKVTQGSVMALGASPSGSLMAVGGLSCTVDIYPINEALQSSLGLERPKHEFNYLNHQEVEPMPYLQTSTEAANGHGQPIQPGEFTSKAPNTIQLQRELARLDPKKALESVSFNPRVSQPSRYTAGGFNNINNYCASLIGHQSSITAIEFLHEHQVVSGSADGAAMVWDVDSGTATNLFRGHEGSINDITPINERTFVSVGSDGYVLLWDTRAVGAQMSFQSSQTVPLNFCEKHHDHSFVTAGRNHLDIFDARSGRCLINYAVQNHNISSLGVSRSGRLLLTGSNIGRCVLLDGIKGQSLGELKGHTGTICGSHFSGPNILTVGHDSLIRNWVHRKR